LKPLVSKYDYEPSELCLFFLPPSPHVIGRGKINQLGWGKKGEKTETGGRRD